MVALLRGVNVGGSTSLAMADLRRAAVDCGFDHVRTYIQSGNLVFSTRSLSTHAVADALRRNLARRTSFRPDVIVRTHAELREVVEANPYCDRGATPTQLHAVFLSRATGVASPIADPASFLPEEACVRGAHCYVYLPGGVGRSRLAAALAKGNSASGTMRNWRTVTRLLELADATSESDA
jgi:uncharacterized protein (DUF1697 family)